MKRILFATALIGATAISGGLSGASAADLPRKTVAPVYVQPVPIFTWTGFYVGINGGYIFEGGKSQVTGFGSSGGLKTMGDGFTVGGTLGYNYQINNFVVGLETDLNYVDLGKRVTTNFGAFSGTVSQDMSYLGTVRGRLGVAFDRVLIYGTGGLAYGNQEARTNITGLGGSFAGSKDSTRFGYTLGAGVEYAISNNWSVKAEYLYYDLGKVNYAAPQIAGAPVAGGFGTTKAENRGNLVRAGLNYRF
jgi:outer membrane immunogenic protein